MLTRFPSEAEILYVTQMEKELKLKLTVPQHEGYLYATACMFTAGTRLLDLAFLHRILYPDLQSAGHYRKNAVYDSATQRVKALPRSSILAKFVTEKFMPVYQDGFRRDPHYSPDIIAWSIGATLRCLCPFDYGNGRVSYLIEHQLNLHHGFPFRYEPRPIDRFYDFRETGFKMIFQSVYQ